MLSWSQTSYSSTSDAKMDLLMVHDIHCSLDLLAASFSVGEGSM